MSQTIYELIFAHNTWLNTIVLSELHSITIEAAAMLQRDPSPDYLYLTQINSFLIAAKANVPIELKRLIEGPKSAAFKVAKRYSDKHSDRKFHAVVGELKHAAKNRYSLNGQLMTLKEIAAFVELPVERVRHCILRAEIANGGIVDNVRFSARTKKKSHEYLIGTQKLTITEISVALDVKESSIYTRLSRLGLLNTESDLSHIFPAIAITAEPGDDEE